MFFTKTSCQPGALYSTGLNPSLIFSIITQENYLYSHHPLKLDQWTLIKNSYIKYITEMLEFVGSLLNH